MAAHLVSSDELAQAEQQPLVYTFGEPRLGDAKWSEVYHSLLPDSKRVVHNHDLIPHYPFRVSYWRGTCFYAMYIPAMP
jgi:hypothetical protein